jgi:hypothetical protein
MWIVSKQHTWRGKSNNQMLLANGKNWHIKFFYGRASDLFIFFFSAVFVANINQIRKHSLVLPGYR